MKSLSENIKEFRKSSKIKIEEIASKMDKSRSAYLRFEENGSKASVEDLLKFCQIINKSVFDVMGFDVETQSKNYHENIVESVIHEPESEYECKKCMEKDARIIDLKANLNDLRNQLEYFQALYRKTGSG